MAANCVSPGCLGPLTWPSGFQGVSQAMGKKRQQRRRRQQRNARKPQRPSVSRYLIPGPRRPLLEVHFEAAVSEEDKALCLSYWNFTEPGVWSHKVADLGSSALVARTVRQSCHACLLTLLCPQCTSPITVRSRSDLAHTRLWRAEVFPLEEQNAKIPCDGCYEAAAEARRRAEAREAEEQKKARQRSKEEQRQAAQARVASAEAWLAGHRSLPLPEDPPSVRDTLALLTMIDIMERKDKDTFGPLSDLTYDLGTSLSADVETLTDLHQKRWIAPALPATTGDFRFRDDNTVSGVHAETIPWRLAPALGTDALQARRTTADTLRRLLFERTAELEEAAQELDTVTAVLYLDKLLTHRYDEEPIPDHRLQEAVDTFRTALRDGFSFGHLLSVAWSATASSVAWGQRTQGLRPGSVGSASVTNLGRRFGYAKDRPVPEYDLPHYVTPPATRATVVRLLEQHGAEHKSLHQFRSLQQAIGSRETEAFELDGDLAEGTDTDVPTAAGTFSADPAGLLDGPPSASKQAPPITYVLVTADGALETRRESLELMKEKVGTAGAGMVDRILISEPPTVNAYVGALVPRSKETANPVADEMLWLLGCHSGLCFGAIVFFAVGPHGGLPRSLDDEQQDMLCAAHQVAQTREAAATR
ncbi:hypothetical protein [Streptomyces sp. Ac-502]|uniref:hypothetical protein n=1 Tax=Streptomyces sp. Ac-502 TaxID=3342801 RepID=UPI0038622248